MLVRIEILLVLGSRTSDVFTPDILSVANQIASNFRKYLQKSIATELGGARRVWEGEIPIHGKKLFEKYNVHVVGMKQLLLKPRDQLLRTQNRELWRRMLNVNETTHLFEYIGLYFYTNEKERWIFREIFEIIWESGGSNDLGVLATLYIKKYSCFHIFQYQSVIILIYR